MTDSILNKAKSYKAQGFNRDQIRTYLKNSGHSDIEVKMTLSQMDSDEIHELYLKQQLKSALHQVIASLVIFAIGLIYNLYNVAKGNGIDALTFVIPTAIVIAAYFRFRTIKDKRYSTSRIIRANRANSQK